MSRKNNKQTLTSFVCFITYIWAQAVFVIFLTGFWRFLIFG